MRAVPLSLPFLCFTLKLAVPVQADVVWADTYTGQTAGAFPSLNYPGGAAGNDYSDTMHATNANFLVEGSVGFGSPSLALVDTVSADAATLTVTMNHFAPFSVGPATATPILRVSFDFRVDSYLSSVNTNVPRFILRADNGNSTGSQMVIGFGYADLNDGDASTGDLALFADTQTGATTNLAPKAGTAIGLNAGTGWAPGFDLGDYDSGSASANDTGDEFYHFTFDYNSISGGISGSVTRNSTGEIALFPTGLSLTAGKSFSSSDANDRFLLASSNGNTATAYFDNFVFEAVPEPASTALLAGGFILLLQRRRRAS
jgi:hypothetical protein